MPDKYSNLQSSKRFVSLRSWWWLESFPGTQNQRFLSILDIASPKWASFDSAILFSKRSGGVDFSYFFFVNGKFEIWRGSQILPVCCRDCPTDFAPWPYTEIILKYTACSIRDSWRLQLEVWEVWHPRCPVTGLLCIPFGNCACKTIHLYFVWRYSSAYMIH